MKRYPSYGTRFPIKFERARPWTWHPEVHEKARRAFELEAYVAVFSDEMSEIMFVREAEAPRARRRYSAALLRLVQFMRAVGFADYVIGEFVELGNALDELDHGTVRHFLRPNPAGQRALDPSDIWVARAYTAMALDFAQQLGVPRKEAARNIATSYEHLSDVLAPRTRNFASVIERWHRSFSEGTVKNAKATATFADRDAFNLHIAMHDKTSNQKERLQNSYYRALDTALLVAVRAATPEMVALARLRKPARK